MSVRASVSPHSSISVRTAALALGFVLVVAGAARPATGSSRGGSVARVVGPGRLQVIRPGAASARRATPPSRGGVSLVTVDSDPYTGYENAVYAPTDTAIYVAYKKFLQDPSGGGYIPAQLRVAKSTDGGQTWHIYVVDNTAIEEGDTIDNSVSIDGFGGEAIYVAYHTRSSGLFADMKLKVATTFNGGTTWTISTVVDSNAGDYNSIDVLGSDTALVSAHAAGTAEGVHLYLTRTGGTMWSDRLVEGGLGNGIYTSVAALKPWQGYLSYYDALYPDDTDLHGARKTRGTLHTGVIDGTLGDSDLTGLGSSICVAGGTAALTAYEADTTQGTFVRVAKATFGQSGWDIVPVQQGSTIGWNTAIHAPDSTHVYVSYWLYDGTGHAVLSTSLDGGTTWAPVTLPEPGYVQPYLDSTAPSTTTQYESYQTYDLSTGATTLRLAKIQA